MATARTLSLAALAAAALLCGPARPASPADRGITVEAADAALRRENGVVRYNRIPLTGRIVEHHPDGAVRSSTPYLRGRRDGVAEGWYADGRPAYRRAFREGREEGEHRTWWPDGRARLVERFRRGRLEGTVREWFADGTPYRVARYRAGLEDGPQRMWFPDGTLRASYEVRDGRRYGIMGAKGCTGENNGLDSAAVALAPDKRRLQAVGAARPRNRG